jgi:hypothetical protein
VSFYIGETGINLPRKEVSAWIRTTLPGSQAG